MTQTTRTRLEQLGLPSGDLHTLPDSPKRFPMARSTASKSPASKVPTCSPPCLKKPKRVRLTIHRISQGSGIMMLSDAEILEMARLGREAQIEVSLFVGPRAAWDTGAQITASSGKNLGARLRGHGSGRLRDRGRRAGVRLRHPLGAGRRRGAVVADQRDAQGGRSALRSGRQNLGADGRG